MRKKIKFRTFVDIEEEENWINKQMENGLRLVDLNLIGIYYFVEDPSNSMVVRTDFREFNRKREFKEYVAFMEDTGWQLLKGSYLFGQHYFIGDKSNGNIELFSDNESRVALYKRREKSTFVVWLMLLVLIFPKINMDFSLDAIFLTPGLWEKTGTDFWQAFFFELPFALGRAGIIYLIMFIFISRELYRYHNKRKYLEQSL